MQLRKTRWSKVYESAEEELVALFAQRHIQAIHWQGEDGQELERQFTVDTQLWCAEGQLTIAVQDASYSLQPGDVLDIPANTTAVIQVGFGGCATYESHAA
jgi:quercetin dioxygenase-like cupin family protein